MPTTTADTSAPSGTSLEEAARAIEGLLDLPEGEDTQAPEATAADAADTEKGDGVAEATSKETPADQQEEETDASDEADTATEAETETAMVTVTIDGKSEAIPLEEVTKGYQRQADYTRKMTALREERESFAAERKAVTEERETYKTMLGALQEQLQSLQPQEPDWDEVYRTDPVGYARRRDEWRDKQDKIAAAKFELERLQGEEKKEQIAQFQKLVAENRVKMFEKNPAWKDPKVWDADRAKLVEYARKEGYSDAEISAAIDPRALIWGHKARLYDELMANKPKPATMKRPASAPAGAARDSNTSNRLNAAQQRLAKSGRIEDAARVFEQII